MRNQRLSPYVWLFVILACSEAVMALLWISTLGLSQDVLPTMGYSAVFAVLAAIAYVRGIPFAGAALNGWLRPRARSVVIVAVVLVPVAAILGITALSAYGALLAIMAAGLSIHHGAQ